MTLSLSAAAFTAAASAEAFVELQLEEADPEALIGDKAYDADPLLDTLTQREITPRDSSESQPQDAADL